MKRYLSVFHSQPTASRFRYKHSTKRFFLKFLDGIILKLREEAEGSTLVGMVFLCLLSVGFGYLLSIDKGNKV